MTKWLLRAFQRLKAAWMSLQVELQGSYSVERLQQLHSYSSKTSSRRLVVVLLVAPLPCIVLSLLKDMPPLEPVDAGVKANWVFFVRSWVRYPSLWVDAKQVLATLHCQMSLPMVYPLYIYGFVSLTGTGQVLFVAVLPMVKLITRNWMNRTLRGRDDIKPETIIFTIEIFNALYISSALQSSSSWTSTVTVMALDVVSFWASMVDIAEVFEGMKKIMDKIPQDHPLAHENFIGGLFQSTQVKPMSAFPQIAAQPNSCNPTNPINLDDICDIEKLFSRAERDFFIRKARHVLFITEYVVLMEYAEVVVPILYRLYRVVLFHLPNSVYYPTLTELSISELSSSTLTVLAYSSLEFVSFVFSIIVMKRALGFNPLEQLGFVLETQANSVQTKPIGIFIYVTQMPLVHLGADFSFKFVWMQDNSTH
ncbi:hypothetical protein PHYSODRAFT_316144 [Phytophthora sojae]|uniref:Uncharacterized protein n=1 Tax=Phytophthora sojae (strain P6497) TaxID=1094619 RepID=G4ZMS0_PHYSP|nr:hypothetical protein PHYSODRAFT_316144 [Phytophthora sojae]EGZ16040.1 hypothetical protein PHYSODRAFT_316144 [Phytophthora sojae]|eukprot:XP_009529789.1 hypothetical protein PHYSODRAFT_316144 [Phytophthora sojae]